MEKCETNSEMTVRSNEGLTFETSAALKVLYGGHFTNPKLGSCRTSLNALQDWLKEQ